MDEYNYTIKSGTQKKNAFNNQNINKKNNNKQKTDENYLVDETRIQINEFRNYLKERKLTKNISNLIRIYVFSILCIMIVSILSLYFSINMKDKAEESIDSLYLVYKRIMILSQVNFQCSRMKFLALDMVEPSNPFMTKSKLENETRSLLAVYNTELQDVNVKANNRMINMGFYKPDEADYKIDVNMQLSDGNKITFKKYFNDAILQYITSVNSIQNSPLTSWNSTGLNSPETEYYYVNYNGLRAIKSESENISEVFYKYYKNKIQDYKIAFSVLLIFIIVLLGLSISILFATYAS